MVATHCYYVQNKSSGQFHFAKAYILSSQRHAGRQAARDRTHSAYAQLPYDPSTEEGPLGSAPAIKKFLAPSTYDSISGKELI